MLMMYFDSKRNVMGDLYKNLVNSMENKENIVLVVPYSYEMEEFSGDFFMKIKEDVSCEKNKIKRVFKLIAFIKRIKHIVKQCNVKKIYFQIDQFIYDVFFCYILPHLDYYVWIHDVEVHDGESWMSKFKKILFKVLLLHRYRKIIVSYNRAREELIKHYESVKNRIVVINLPRLKELEFEDIKENEYEMKYDFIFYGRIEKYKGLDILLKSMEDEAMSKVKLLVVGRGREEEKIKCRIQHMDNVTFVNKYIDNKGLARLIASSRFVILPYRSATGTQTIQLANYYGKMVLATRVGCFAEYIEEGVNGMFIEECTSRAILNAMCEILKIDEKNKKGQIEEKLSMFDLLATVRKLENVLMS